MKTYVRPSAIVSASCAFAIILLAAASGITSAQTNTFPSSGNAGVGTTSPVTALQVIGNDSLRGVLRLRNIGSTGLSGIEYERGSDGAVTAYVGIDSSNSFFRFNSINSFPLAFLTESVERMRITSGGNIGIGTINPAGPVDVQTNSATANKLMGRFGNNSASGGAAVRVYANTATNSTLYPAFELSDDSFWIGTLAADRTTGLRFRTGTNVSSGEANLTDRMVVSPGGNVGIGTTSPGFRLDVQSNSQWAARFKKTDSTHGGILIDSASGFNPNLALSVNGTIKWYMNSNVANGDSWQLWESTGGNPRVTLTQDGNFGIGTQTPAKRLSVNGDIEVTGNIAAKYQDVAEWVPATRALPPGTVVTLSRTHSNLVEASAKAYDTRVAGVISEQPGITLGERGENKVLVATTGRVRIKVDATNAPIELGDLLVTSDKEGLAMKSVPVNIGGVQIHQPGTLIGKALEPLAKGQGKILVLLSLQ